MVQEQPWSGTKKIKTESPRPSVVSYELVFAADYLGVTKGGDQ